MKETKIFYVKNFNAWAVYLYVSSKKRKYLGIYKEKGKANYIANNPSLYVPVDKEAAKKNPLNQDDLKYLFDYTEDGSLINKVKRNTKILIGEKVCGIFPSMTKEDYHRCTINGNSYKLHRLIWIYHNGPIPEGMQIDHINHDRQDNRIENLRLVENSQENLRNMSMINSNSSGHMGVCYLNGYTGRKSWHAYIYVNNKKIGLGKYITKEEAIKVRKEAEEKYGFHPNHGK